MDPRCRDLIRMLDLQAHHEGGFFRQLFRSSALVTRQADMVTRTALTSIAYLLPEGSISRWHRVWSDEAWHHYEGSPLELLTFSPDGSQSQVIRLGVAAANVVPVHVVPAGWWQAARPLGAYSLLGCTVGPGFEFEDFVLLADLPDDQRVAPVDIPEFQVFL